ncbi:uncharacterized protein TNCV_314491 [Trichonephila clavipes]|nr:uncharacterized protein TNCV_314491 [Trichonephila clavipes]
MSDIEMDPPSPAPSYKAYEEQLISRPSTPLPPEPTTACVYQKFLATFNKGKDEHGVYRQLQESLKETIEARDSLKKEENAKNNTDDFVFPSKTARPTTPTPVLQPIAVQNSFVNLDQGPEIPADNAEEILTIKPPLPVFLKINNNYRKQLDQLKEKFPDLKSKTSGKDLKLNLDSHDDHRDLVNFMDENKDFQFYVLPPKDKKPIKIVIKGLPGCTKPEEIINDLEHQGYSDCSCNQLISKRTKLPLPFYLITLPRNTENQTIFDIKHVGHMQVKIEGYSVKGTTQCFNCNFFHTAANCHMLPRCLKCGKEHLTKDCEIKDRQENPYCINCEAYGHTACYTKCPKFPKPKKDTPIANRNNKVFTSNNVVEGISFANMVSGKPKNNDPQTTNTNKTTSERQSHPITPPTDEISLSDFQDLITLFKIVSNIFKQFPKLKQIIPELKKTKDFQKQAFLSSQTNRNSPPQSTKCAFTPLVPPPSGHTSSPPKPSEQRNSPIMPDIDGGIGPDSSSL